MQHGCLSTSFVGWGFSSFPRSLKGVPKNFRSVLQGQGWMLLSVSASVSGFYMKMSCTGHIFSAKCHPCTAVPQRCIRWSKEMSGTFHGISWEFQRRSETSCNHLKLLVTPVKAPLNPYKQPETSCLKPY